MTRILTSYIYITEISETLQSTTKQNMADQGTNPTIYYHSLTMKHVDLYRVIRLRALSESPSSFDSVFEDQISLPREWWENRVHQHHVITLVASTLEDLPETFDAMGWDYTTPSQFATHDSWLCSLVICMQYLENAEEAYLKGMWVAPGARKRGIATKLVQRALDWAKDHVGDKGKFESVVLDIPHNQGARRLYESCGFVEVGDPGGLRYEFKL